MNHLTFLGTGTSQGVPIIGCTCRVCTSGDAKDKRLRTAAQLHLNGKNIIIDAGPDFRMQMLRQNINDVEAIFITHDHSDHIAGLEDVRPYNFRQKKPMPLFTTFKTERALRKRYAYAFEKNPYPGSPSFDFVRINKNKKFMLNGITFQPIEVIHGRNSLVMGFRFGDVTYITDCKYIEPTEFKKLTGTRILILNALHRNTHHSHMNLEEAIAMSHRVQPRQTFFTHISHGMGLHEEVNAALPKNMSLAYDGLRVDI